MRRMGWMAFLLGCALLVGCQSAEPIVGRWAPKAEKAPGVVYVFQKGGKLELDVSAAEAQAKKQGVPEQQIATLREQLKKTSMTWEKEGSLYKAEIKQDGKLLEEIFFRFQGKELVPCGKDGKPRGEMTLVRKQ